MAKKIADELEVTVNYLIGGTANMMLDKKILKRMEDIEALPPEEKEKVYYFIDMAITYNKAKKHTPDKTKSPRDPRALFAYYSVQLSFLTLALY